MRLDSNVPGWISLTLLGLLVAPIGVIMVGNSLHEQHFNRGLKAYEQGDCKGAIPEMDHYLKDSLPDDTEENIVKARAIQTECKLFQDVSNHQQTGKVDSALTVSAQLAKRYPNSLLIPKVQRIANDLLTKQPIATLAKSSSCKEFETITQFVISQENAPPFYQACGQVFEKARNYTEAIGLYEKFFDRFPKHALMPAMLKAYSQALYAQAEGEGAGDIPPPIASATTGDGSTVIEIRNDSPEKMRIVFGGPTSRIEELPGCSNCQEFNSLNLPNACPEKGPVGKYTIEPGDYKIVVKSSGDRVVTPFIGNWSMAQNTLYSHCFYIVRTGFQP
jgi:outer membrane protein assembly factor BamD (BamD/ComL family)